MIDAFINPYQGCEKDGNGVRLQTYIPAEEYRYVQRIRGGRHGTMATTINILFAKLVAALKERGISDFTHEQQFEEFVANLAFHEKPARLRGKRGGSAQTA